MNKTVRTVICILMLLALAASFLLPAFAAEPREEETPELRQLHIQNEEEFLEFAESCRIDSFSQGLEVHLDADLDLTGLEFTGIPIFYGQFRGHNHVVGGLELTVTGSNVGLFRFLEEGASVSNLTVKAQIAPQGSRQTVGGIVGSSAGTLTSCRFDGDLNGQDFVGGIVGINRVSGIIEDCIVRGNLHGDHFVGGMAGQNLGVVRNCINYATINTTARENTVEITDISFDTITGTESANTVTDVGGIAGTSSGVIRECVNRGNVGYRHMGYNIGGIAGSQKGYIGDCANYGTIYARKEAGGIVGQLEPISKIEYSVDTLQILRGQLASASASVSRVAANAQRGASSITANLQGLRDQSDIAKESLDVLLPGGQEPFPPDPDAFLAAQNALAGSMQEMKSLMGQLSRNTQGTAGQLTKDLRALTGQMNAMGATLNDAGENLGGTVTDISDLDTGEEMNGEVAFCHNFGAVDGDINAGGIVGSMAFENDFDPEDDLQVFGDPSLNFNSEVRAVVFGCENRAPVTAKKSSAGGIVGWVSLGLVKDCINTGHLDTGSAELVGGIAGSSQGYLRGCASKSLLSGTQYLGGIAGKGSVVTDCLSMVYIMEADERFGAVLGSWEEPKNEDITEPLKNNVYLSLSQDPGAIDGISYQGLAEPLSMTRFLSRENLPQSFQEATITFRFEDGQETQVVLPIGTALNSRDIPELPKKDGYDGSWKGLEESETSHVYFDMTFSPEYISHRMTVESTEKRESGRSVLLAEGKFPRMEQIDMTALDTLPQAPKGSILEGWEIPTFHEDGATALHYCAPQGQVPERLAVLVRSEDGSWRQAESTVNGSYLVFSVEPGDSAIAMVLLPDYSWIKYVVIGAASGVLAVTIVAVKKKNKKN